MPSRPAFNTPDFTWGNHRPLIAVDGLEKVFTSLAGSSRVLKNIHLEIASGEFVSIIGRSGSGKSTLINMLTGIDHPTSGKIRIGDTILEAMPEGKMAEWRGKTLGIVFQFFQLLPTMTLLENVLLPMDFCRMYSPGERVERAHYLLGLVGLGDLGDALPGAISGGQQQCAAVARALANDPPVVVADEPTGNLDSGSAEGVLGLFETLVQQGKTILMVTHDRGLAKRANRSILLSDGEIVEDAITRAFSGLADEKLLHLSEASRESEYGSGARITQPEINGQGDILVVKKGVIRIVKCAGAAGGQPDLGSLQMGRWLDLRRLTVDCPQFELHAEGGPAVILWIPGSDYDTITAHLPHSPHSAPSGGTR